MPIDQTPTARHARQVPRFAIGSQVLSHGPIREQKMRKKKRTTPTFIGELPIDETGQTTLEPAQCEARVKAFESLYRDRDLQESVSMGTWRVLKTCSDLLGDPYQREAIEFELANQVWFWAWLNVDALLTPGTAKLGTRLNQRAFWSARAWKTTLLRDRARHVQAIDDVWLERRSILGTSSIRWDADRTTARLAA